MGSYYNHPLKLLALLLLIGFTTVGSTCSNGEILGGSAGGVVATTYLATIPSNDIEQVYYLGVFDPQEQVPPTIYRVTVRGQASAISSMRFGSGWVPAEMIDSLNTSVGFDPATGRPKSEAAAGETLSKLKTGRRLMMFGPEGFREAPKDHRLVMVMGGSPEAFFSAIDEALGTVGRARIEQLESGLKNDLLKEMIKIKNEKQNLTALQLRLATTKN